MPVEHEMSQTLNCTRNWRRPAVAPHSNGMMFVHSLFTIYVAWQHGNSILDCNAFSLNGDEQSGKSENGKRENRLNAIEYYFIVDSSCYQTVRPTI